MRKDSLTHTFKKMDDPGNYWPVRLTSTLGKVMEQITLEVVIKHVKEHHQELSAWIHHGEIMLDQFDSPL